MTFTIVKFSSLIFNGVSFSTAANAHSNNYKFGLSVIPSVSKQSFVIALFPGEVVRSITRIDITLAQITGSLHRMFTIIDKHLQFNNLAALHSSRCSILVSYVRFLGFSIFISLL